MAVFYGVFFLLLVPTAAWELNRGRNNEGRGQKEKYFDLERRRIKTNQKRKTHRKNHQPRRLLQLRLGQLGFTFSELPVLQTGEKKSKLRYDHHSGNCNLNNVNNPDKICMASQGFQPITHGLYVSTTVLYQLSYEDPYTGSRPICWVHLTP